MIHSNSSYDLASPSLRAEFIKDGLLHLNAQLRMLTAEARILNGWLTEYPARNEAHKVDDINATTLHHLIESFSHASDELTNQVIATAQNLDTVKNHISSKAIKSLKQ